MAEDQYLKDVELPPKRGRILDRNGVELAASTEVDSVHVNARMLIAADRVGETARALAEALHLDRRELEKKLHGAALLHVGQAAHLARRGARGARAGSCRACTSTASRGATIRTAGWRGRCSAGRGSTPSGRRASSCSTSATCAGRARSCRGCATRSGARCSSAGSATRPTWRGTICTRRSIATSSFGSSGRSRRAWRRIAPRRAWRWRSIRTTARSWPWRRCRRSIPTSPTGRASAARAIARSPIRSSRARR